MNRAAVRDCRFKISARSDASRRIWKCDMWHNLRKCGMWHNLYVPYFASRGPGRPPAAKAAETRRRIIRAACEVFGERGYDAATFQAIAVRADLTRPAINHYFSSKRALYREVVRETNEVVVTASIQRARRETTLIGRVSAFIEAARGVGSENRPAAALLITLALESQRHPDLSREEPDSIHAAREFLSWAINEAIERGELARDADAAALTELLVTVLLGVGFYAGFVGSRQELDAVIGQLEQLLTGGLARRPE
jgi:TetR/AcrR family transcriptional regulator, repressor for uid operon